MNIVVMGTGQFAVPTFEWLVESPYIVRQLVTRPVQLRGRRRPPPNPMRDLAKLHGVPVIDPHTVNEPATIGLLAELRPDLLFVCDYGQILSKQVLAVPPLGGINLHGSLLPAYRGAAPVNWAIYDGAEQTGVSVIHMTPRLDAGPVLSMRSTPIGPAETAEELERRLAVLGVDAVRDALKLLASWDRVSELGERQDAKSASRAASTEQSRWPRELVAAGNPNRQSGPRLAALARDLHLLLAGRPGDSPDSPSRGGDDRISDRRRTRDNRRASRSNGGRGRLSGPTGIGPTRR